MSHICLKDICVFLKLSKWLIIDRLCNLPSHKRLPVLLDMLIGPGYGTLRKREQLPKRLDLFKKRGFHTSLHTIPMIFDALHCTSVVTSLSCDYLVSSFLITFTPCINKSDKNAVQQQYHETNQKFHSQFLKFHIDQLW